MAFILAMPTVIAVPILEVDILDVSGAFALVGEDQIVVTPQIVRTVIEGETPVNGYGYSQSG